MKFEIPVLNLKILARAVQYLSKIGDEIQFVTDGNGLNLSTVNNAKTAFATVRFSADFFLEFSESATSGQEEDNFCKVAVRTLLPIFRSLHNVEDAVVDFDATTSSLNFKFNRQQQATMSFSLAILDLSRFMDPRMPSDYENKIIGSHKVFVNLVTGFHNSTREISFEVSKTSASVRNYIDDPDKDVESIRSSQSMQITEFDMFAITHEGKLGFSLADFKAFVTFADQSEVNIRLTFGAPGHPMSMFCRSGTGYYEADLFAATIIDDSACPILTLPTQSGASKRPASVVSEDFNFRAPKRTTRAPSVKVTDSGSTIPKTPSEQLSLSLAQQNSDPVPSLIFETESSKNLSHVSASTNLNLNAVQPLPSDDSTPAKTQLSHPPATQSFVRATMSVDIEFETEDDKKKETEDFEIVPGSPQPPTKARKIFARCFEKTFLPTQLPGADDVLAPNSDGEDFTQ